MTITTWSSFSKRRNSTKQPTGGTSKTVRLKNPTSIINPVFLIQSFNLADNYLQWGSRYYFIDDIVIVNNDMAEYHCSVDALASWKTSIGSMQEFVARSASRSDGYITDLKYPIQSYTDIQETTLSGITSAFMGSTYVVGIIGDAGESNAINYYAMTATQFSDLLDFMFGGTWLDTTETDITIPTQKELVNPFQYVVSCRWYPFSITGSSTTIKFGWWQSDVSADLLTGRSYAAVETVTLPRHGMTSDRGLYMNAAPFTSRSLYCYNFGKIDLDPEAFINSQSLTVDISVDYWGGAAVLQIKNASGLMNMLSCDFGVPVPMSSMAADFMQAGAAMTASQGGLFGAVATIASVAGSIGQSLGIGSSHAKAPTVSMVGSQGTSVVYQTIPKVVTEFKYPSNQDVEQFGRPLCQKVTLNTLAGFIQTEGADVDLPCTQEERDQIAAYMDGGFFYE